MMQFWGFDHQGKGERIFQSLLASGWNLNSIKPDVYLVDHDGDFAHPRPAEIDYFHSVGTKIVLYPHGAAPTVTFYDGAYPPDSRIHARLEHGAGHLEIARRIGLQGLRQHVIGWSYSDWRPFQPVKDPRRILFAPIQPNGNGQLSTHDGMSNHLAFKELRRYKGCRTHQPGYPAPVQSAITAIEAFAPDLVVAAGTFAYTALALGKPVVMIHDRNLERGTVPEHLSLYDSYQTYPLTIRQHGDLEAMLSEACAGSERIEEWKRLFVGGPMRDVASFLERIVKEEEPVGDSRPSALLR